MNTDAALIWILVLAQILICMDRKVAAAVGCGGGDKASPCMAAPPKSLGKQTHQSKDEARMEDERIMLHLCFAHCREYRKHPSPFSTKTALLFILARNKNA